MSRSASAVLGVLALAASASASHSLRRTSSHARVAAARRSDDAVSGVAYYGYQNNTTNACGTVSSDADMIIGIGPNYYGDINSVSSRCFEHITVALADDSGRSVDVTLTDACQDCGAKENVYLSPAAFKALSGGSLDVGVLHVIWDFDTNSIANSGSTPSSTGSTPSSTGSDDEDDEDCEDGTDEQDGTATTAATSFKAAAAPTTSKGTAATATSSKAAAAPTTSKGTATTAKTTTAKASTPTKTNSVPSPDGWKIAHALEGSTFLDFFNYDTGTGDNGGVANYVNGDTAGLASVQGKQVILSVDTTQNVQTRNSLRLVSKAKIQRRGQPPLHL